MPLPIEVDLRATHHVDLCTFAENASRKPPTGAGSADGTFPGTARTAVAATNAERSYSECSHTTFRDRRYVLSASGLDTEGSMLHWLMGLLHSLGAWLVELAVTVTACAVAYPVIRVGTKWRLYFRAMRAGYHGGLRRQSIAYAGVGTVILVAVG